MTGWEGPDWDAEWFLVLHRDWTCSWLDSLFPVYRDKRTWLPLYGLLLVWLWRRLRSTGLVVALMAGASVGIADGISSSVIKPAVGRLRPCRTEALQPFIRDLIECGPGLSFPSSHAANHLALSMFLFLLFRRHYPLASWLALLWGFSIGYAQIYVGLHFPLDVLAGSALGALIGWGMAWLFLFLQPGWHSRWAR
ncbi:MAG: phosphatase PAP2 family protein [Bacteroidetes bacterium]|nr:phosphatase PAP2 family protein [Bacteroidota bacterium]